MALAASLLVYVKEKNGRGQGSDVKHILPYLYNQYSVTVSIPLSFLSFFFAYVICDCTFCFRINHEILFDLLVFLFRIRILFGNLGKFNSLSEFFTFLCDSIKLSNMLNC